MIHHLLCLQTTIGPQIVPAIKSSMVLIKAEMTVETNKVKIIEGMRDTYPLLREEINLMNENLKSKPSESTTKITVSNIGSILKEWPGMKFFDHFHKLRNTIVREIDRRIYGIQKIYCDALCYPKALL